MDKKEKIKFIRNVNCLKYRASFRRKVVEEYLRTGKPKLHIQRAYNIKYKSAINKWLKDFGIDDPHSKKSDLADKKKSFLERKKEQESKHLTAVELAAKVTALEQELEDKNIQLTAYLRMIEIAEKQYQFSIRKKPNTK